MPKTRVFSTPTCPYCVTLKEFLKANNIEFEDINLANNLEAQKEMIDATGQMGVPQIEIEGQWVVGFDKEKISQLLKLEN